MDFQCIFCHENKEAQKIIFFTAATYQKCCHILERRKLFNLKYSDVRLPLSLLLQRTDGYHSGCYSNFTGVNKKYRDPDYQDPKFTDIVRYIENYSEASGLSNIPEFYFPNVNSESCPSISGLQSDYPYQLASTSQETTDIKLPRTYSKKHTYAVKSPARLNRVNIFFHSGILCLVLTSQKQLNY